MDFFQGKNLFSDQALRRDQQDTKGGGWRSVPHTLCRLFQTCRTIGVYLSSEEYLHRNLTRQGLGYGWFFWWVAFNSLKTWMSHFQVSRDLDESLSSLSRLGWGLERRGTGSLSSSVDCCYSNLLDLLRVKTHICSYNLYTPPFLSFPSHLTSVKFIKLKQSV